MIVALVFCVGSVIVYSPPTRPCHRCGRRLATTAAAAGIAAIASATRRSNGRDSQRSARHAFDAERRRSPRMLAELLGLVAPPRCAVCARECGPREHLCERCESGLRGLAPCSTPIPGLDAAWSAAPYEGVARDLVVALKFAGAASACEAGGRGDRRAGAGRPASRARSSLSARPGAPATKRGSTRRRKSPRRSGSRPASRSGSACGARRGGARWGGRGPSGWPSRRACASPARPLRRRAGGRRGHHGRDAGCLRRGRCGPAAAAGSWP